MIIRETIYILDRMKTWSSDLSDEEIEALVSAIRSIEHLEMLKVELEEVLKMGCSLIETTYLISRVDKIINEVEK